MRTARVVLFNDDAGDPETCVRPGQPPAGEPCIY